MGDGFIGQKTQPTVSKYLKEKTLQKKTQKTQTTQNTAIQ